MPNDVLGHLSQSSSKIIDVALVLTNCIDYSTLYYTRTHSRPDIFQGKK